MRSSSGVPGWGKRPDTIVHELEPFNAEPAPAALLADLLTPIDAFYSRNHGFVPNLDPTTWRLGIGGLVDHPLQVSLRDLQGRFDTHTVTATLQCAGNRRAGLLAVRDIPGEAPWRDGATSTATWTGVRLCDVLGHVQVHHDPASHVAFSAPDLATEADPPQTYGSSIPLTKALACEVLLAWAMNGEPLPAIHGGPVRVVVPATSAHAA